MHGLAVVNTRLFLFLFAAFQLHAFYLVAYLFMTFSG